MSNPLFNALSRNPINNIVQQLNQLKSMGGDPNQHIQRLLNSGRISQSDYDAAVKKAQSLMNMLNRK